MKCIEEEDIDLNLSQRDKILADTGVKFTKKYFIKNYGFEDEDITVQEEGGQVLPQVTEEIENYEKLLFEQFAQNDISKDQQTIDAFIESFLEDELQNQAESVLKETINLIKNADSYEEIQEQLFSEQGLKTDAIEKNLQKTVFISEVWGKLNANT